MQRIVTRCDLCAPSTRPGLLWLGGGDWVECPQCVGGKLEIIQQDVQPVGRIFIPGSTRGATLHHPEHRRRFG